MSIFKQKEGEPKKDLEAQLCATCGHYFKKDTGHKRRELLTNGKKRVYWFCKEHKPNWDFATWGEGITPEYKNLLKRRRKGEDFEWYPGIKKYMPKLFYFKKTPNKKVKPNYKINIE